MTWEAEIDELRRRRQLAEACGGPEAVAKHHKSGKLTVRERIAGLLDRGSFQEVGKLAGKGSYDKDGKLVAFEPAPVARAGRVVSSRILPTSTESRWSTSSKGLVARSTPPSAKATRWCRVTGRMASSVRST
jgi:hypothetical protein